MRSPVHWFFSLLALLPSWALFPAWARGAQPTLVVFIADDHGQQDSTPYGARDVMTPNMQRLADEGLVFTHAFVASPACAPSRTAMLTGLMPARNGAEANHTSKRPDVRSLVADLKQLGYEVAAFGKIAHGKQASLYGFDLASDKYDVDTIAAYLRQREPSRPLCLMVGTRHPHVPWSENTQYDPLKIQLPTKHLDTPLTRSIRAQYYTDVTNADRQLGEIYALARREFKPSDTLFIYTSDHGAQWPFGKWNLYDSGTRVPFIAVWQGVIQPGRSDAMIQWIDLMPTLIEAAGGSTSDQLDGRSFHKVMLGQRASHRQEIYTTHHNDGRKNIYPIRSVRTTRFKYILNLEPSWAHTTHIDQGGGSGDGWRYFHQWIELAQSQPQAAERLKSYYQRPREELYDLLHDPDELVNLAEDTRHQPTLLQLRDKLTQWRASQGDQTPVTEPPRLLADPKAWQPFRPE